MENHAVQRSFFPPMDCGGRISDFRRNILCLRRAALDFAIWITMAIYGLYYALTQPC